MARNEKINIEVGLVTDKKALSELESSLEQIIVHAKLPGNEMNQSFQQAAKTARELQTILGKTYNKDLGALNVNKFNQELKKSQLTLQGIQSNFSNIGKYGTQAFQLIGTSILQTNIKLKQSSKLLNDMAVTFKNTVRYGISSSVFNTMANSIQRAYNFSKDLDTSLNDIRIVTGQSAEQMDLFATKANKVAQELRATTLDFTKAALIYYQQGLGDVESQARAAVTVKTANVTGQSASDVSEQLTAVWNGYKVSADEVEYYVDKLAKVAAGTAADLEELSTGMSKVASAANNAGVDIDQMNAMLATVISVTREAPETIGTSFRTLFARMGDLKLGATDEDGVGLGKISKQLDAIGVKVLDQEGNMRAMGDVIEDLAKKWQTLDRAQQQAAAVAIGGKMQYSRLIALMDNWDMYTDAINMSKNAIGTLQEQQEIYEQSTEAQLNKLQATWEDFYMSLIRSDEIGSGIGILTNIVKTFDNFIESFGGGGKSILAFGTIVANVFRKQIGESIARVKTNFIDFKDNIELVQQKQALAQIYREDVNKDGNNNTDTYIKANYEKQLELSQKIYEVRTGITQEMHKEAISMQEEIGDLAGQIADSEERIRSLKQQYQAEQGSKWNASDSGETIMAIEEAYPLWEGMEKKAISLNEQFANMRQTSEGIVITNKEYQTIYGKIKNLYEQTNKLTDIQNDYIQEGVQATKADLKTLLQKSKTLEDFKKNYRSIQAIMLETVDTAGNQAAELERQRKDYEDIGKEVAHLDELQSHLTAKQLEMDSLINKGSITAGIEKKVTGVTSSLASMTSAWATVNMIFTTFTDNSLSAWDKLTQLISTSAMLVPTLISSWKGFASVFGVTTSLLDVHNAKKIAKLALDEKDIVYKETDTLWTKMNNIAKKQGVDVDTWYLKTGKTIDKYRNVWIARKKVETAETLKAKAAQDAYNSSLLANPYLLAAAAAIALIAVIVKVKSEEKSALEQAEEASKHATESAKEAKTAYENLQKSFEDYDKGVSALEELDEATEEYKNTLKETNDIILQLISNSAELAQYVTRNPKTGLLEFNPEGRQRALEEAENKSNRLQSAASFAEYEENKERFLVTRRNDLYASIGANEYTSTYFGAEGDTSVWVPYAEGENPGPYGSSGHLVVLSGEMLQDVLDMLASEQGDLIEEDLRKTLHLDSEESWKKYVASRKSNYVSGSSDGMVTPSMTTGGAWTENTAESIINYFLQHAEDFNSFAQKQKEYNEQQKIFLEEGIQSYLKTNKNFSELSDTSQYAITTLLGQQNLETVRKQVEAEWWQDAPAPFGGGNEDAVHYEYAKLMGYDTAKTKDHVWDTAEYWDPNEKKYVSVEDDVARAEIVNAKMAEALTKNEENLQGVIDNVKKISDLTSNKTSDLVMSALGGNLNYKNLGLSDYNALKDLINSEAFTEGLKEVDWEILEKSGYKSGEEFVKAINDNLGDNSKFIENSRNALVGIQGDVGNLTNDILAGKVTEKDIGDNENYKKLQSQLPELIAYQSELNRIAQETGKTYEVMNAEVAVLNNTALVGTEQWIQSLYKVQDEINKITLEKKRQELEKSWNKFKEEAGFTGDDNQTALQLMITSNIEDFETQLNNLLDQDYSITLEIHSQAEQAFTQISSAMDNIKKQAALIGEDFIVSAENARALGNTFPGIYEQAEISATGQIKLNRDIAQSAIDAAKQEVEASAIETEKKLQDARDQAKMKQLAYEAAAKAARAYAESDMESEDEAKTFATKMEEALSLVRQQSSEDAQTEAEKVTTNANANAEQTAKNWGSSYENAAKFAVKFAETAIKAQKDIANGTLTTSVNSSDFKVNYTGQNGKSAEIKEIENYTDILSEKGGSKEERKAALERIATTFDSLADAQGKLVNDIDSMLMSTGAKRMEALNALNQTGSAKDSGSSKNPDKVTENADELDRYEKVNAQLEIISNNLSDINKKKEKLFGKDYIAELNKEIAELNKQIQVTNDKLKIQRDEQEELRIALKDWGLTFSEADNAEGDNQYMLNYGDIWTLKHNALVEAEQKYNKMSVEEQEAFKITLDALEEDWKDFLKKTSRYDALIGEIHTSLENKVEAERNKIADNIEKFGLELTIRLDMQEAIKDWDKFKRDVTDDWNEIWKTNTFSKGFFDENKNWQTNLKRNAQEDLDLLKSYFYKSYESMANPGTMLQGSGLVGTQTEKLKELRGEVEKAFNGQNGLFGEDQYIETRTALDNLKEYKENAINTATEIKDLIDSIKGAYLGTLQEATEEFSEQVDLLERAGKYIEHDMKLIKLVYGDNQYESLSKYYEKQHENNLRQLDFQTKQRDFWKAQMDLAEENSDEWEYAKEQWLSAIDSANAALEQAVETAKEKWENAIDEVFEKLDRKFTDGLGLDYVKEEWSLINKNSDEYLDAINSAYGIQKLQNKYLDAIDKSTDINNQRRLNELMGSEIEYLQQIDRLTKTDLDRAELKLQIALKQMELEDAQNAKTTMRLRRDSQGNYNYQFVANQDDIGKAREELDELNNKLYNFDLNAYRTNLDKAASAYEEFMQKMAEAAKIVNEEDRIAQETLLKEQYYEYIGMLQDENERFSTNLIESAITEHGELYEQEALDFKNMTDQEIDAFMGNLVPQWESGVKYMMEQWSGPDGFKESVETAVDELMEKDQEYRDDLDKIQETAGVVFDDIKRSADDTRLTALEPFIQVNDDIIHKYEEQVQYIVKELIPVLKDLQAEYQALIKEINEANRLQGIEYETAATDAGRDWEESRKLYDEYDDLNSNIDDAKALVEDGSDSSANTEEDISYNNKKVTTGQVIAGFTGKYFYDSYGTDPAGVRKSGKAVKVDTFSSVDYGGTQKTGSYAIHISDAATGAHLGWVRPEDLEGFNTGGYTGTWGSDGRLAFLHQKELVLNETDTSNFLNALDIMRNIVSNIGSDAFTKLAGIGGNRIGDPAFAGIEQNVVINADFPNATDHNEIQQAFDNLMNIASQRINRK